MIKQFIKTSVAMVIACSVSIAFAADTSAKKEGLATYIKNMTMSSIEKVTNSHITDPDKVDIQNNAMASLTLSNHDINRLYVKGDPITDINAPNSKLSVKNDDTGSLYVNVYGNQPFTAYIKTLKQRHFALLILPKGEPGKTVELNPTTPYIPKTPKHNSTARKYEYSNAFVTSMVNILKIVMADKIPHGYKIADRKTKRHDPVFHVEHHLYHRALSQSLIEGMLGGDYAIRIISIQNKSHKVMHLQEYNFYTKGVRAVAMGRHTLAHKQRTVVYEVVDNV